MDRATFNELYAWVPVPARNILWESYIETGEGKAMWLEVRNDSRYESWFPGNMTEDGRPRYEEVDYANITAQYDDVFRAYDLNPVNFQPQYGMFIAGEVMPQELEAYRVAPMYERIIGASDYIKQRYANEFGIPMTDAALLASALDPEIGRKYLADEITLAEIGGEAAESGFDISRESADELMRADVDKAYADRMFKSAENFLPVLNVLSKRHADPDDEFDLEEFVSADLFSNPTQRRRMRRLVAQEQSGFTDTSATLQRDRNTGMLSGVTQF